MRTTLYTIYSSGMIGSLRSCGESGTEKLVEVLSMSKQNTLTIEADEGYRVKLVTRRRVLIESPDGETYQVDSVAGEWICSASGTT